jgi:hypothetical protein
MSDRLLYGAKEIPLSASCYNPNHLGTTEPWKAPRPNCSRVSH